jgi:glycosyltransferase involved in cell wall biosynthesis
MTQEQGKRNNYYRICHFTSVHPWHDIRIYKKMCVSLAESGFELILIAPNAEEGIHEGVQVISVPAETGSRFKRVLNTAKQVYLKALEVDADLYHFHDPELLPFGKKLAKYGKKVVYDSHEDVPSDILYKDWIKPSLLRKLVSKVYNFYEKRTICKLAGIISVSAPITAKFKHPLTATIKNYPLVEKIAQNAGTKSTGQLKLNYSGGLSQIRGIKELVQAVEYMKTDVSLVITGAWQAENYRIECEALNGWKKVDYRGLVSLEENYKIISQCHIGVVNLLPIGNNLNSLPIKTYEYFACGLVVQMSDLDFWKEEFGDYAFYHDPYRPKELAKKLDYLAENRDQFEKWAESGKNFIIKERSWKSQHELLVAFYNKILG